MIYHLYHLLSLSLYVVCVLTLPLLVDGQVIVHSVEDVQGINSIDGPSDPIPVRHVTTGMQ